MALFEKADADLKAQRDAEAALRSKRRDRESLNEKLGLAEAAIVSYRAQARQLAADGADDKAISAAEGKMRDSQDRVQTLTGALADVDKIIAGLEARIDETIDKRCRIETSQAVDAMSTRLSKAASAFDDVAEELEAAAREALVIPESQAVAEFTLSARQQLKPAIAMITASLGAHAKAVLSGHAPASLPRPAPPPPVLTVVPPPETQNIFLLRNLKFVNQAGGLTTAGRYKRADLPKKLAELALSSGAALPIGDKRCRDLEQMASPLQPDETSCEWIGARGPEAPVRSARPGGPPIHSSLTTFTPMDRGAPFKASFTRPPEPEAQALAVGARNAPDVDEG